MDFSSGTFWLSVLQIVWIDLLLSGDNAVVIALAVRSLPAHQRRTGILLGAGTAVGLRIVFALVISYLLAVPFLDNVVAIAAASKGHPELFIFGLLLSIPLIIAGASLITNLIKRYPVVIWAGAALLGWIAGEMIITDPFFAERLADAAGTAHYIAAAVGAVFVVGLGYVLRRQATKMLETQRPV